ncbi:MAG TPA: DUF262 domain-containing HNH endonuclease family protein [Allosphingosinicella sp.]|jgi:hypothetical protein
MDVQLRVTDAPEESSFSDLVSGDNVLAIPLFQRPYRWNAKHLQLLLEDVNSIRDEVTNSVFLGVIVSYSRGTSPGRPVTWEIVDGQQRISTIYLLIMAAVELAARRGDAEWAAAVVGTYLVVRPLASNPVNTKLVPSYADRAQFAALWTRLADIPSLRDNKQFAFNAPMPPPASGPHEGAMTAQYIRLRRGLSKIFEDGGQESLTRYVEVIAHHMSVVSISLRDPAVAPKIFERLNSRAEPVTIADLARNEIFSRSGDSAVQAQHVFNTYWEPFVDTFKASNTEFDKFLFPYGLIQNPNVRKADLFPQLRSHWRSLEGPQQIISDLERYRPTFLALEAGLAAAGLTAPLNARLNRLHRVGRPSSTYAFILQLLDSYHHDEISEQQTLDVLEAVESFLFRRAILGIEPTGLHAAFKNLWRELRESGLEINGQTLRQALRAKPTISWPSDQEFRGAIVGGDLYHRKVCAYAVREYELSVKGETPADSFVVEHVAPQTLTEAWRQVLEEADHSLIHTWGNLIPLTERMNPSVGQKPFLEKKLAFQDSIFATARQVANSHSVWDASVIRSRNHVIAEWARARWRF